VGLVLIALRGNKVPLPETCASAAAAAAAAAIKSGSGEQTAM
jgi:hypothetical protein